jgi:DNA-binding transcriptional regulator YiaG
LLTGADLASYRAWLGVSQRALAARFGVEQGTISKGESHPRALLGPTLRRALHLAMGQPREDGPTPDAPSSLAS